MLIWNLLQTIKDYVHEPGLTDPDDYAKRLVICNQCPLRNNQRCGKCGCYITLKARLKNIHCPDARWPGDKVGDKMDFTISYAIATCVTDIKQALTNFNAKEKVNVFAEPGIKVDRNKNVNMLIGDTSNNLLNALKWMSRNRHTDLIILITEEYRAGINYSIQLPFKKNDKLALIYGSNFWIVKRLDFSELLSINDLPDWLIERGYDVIKG